jgi:hypothetical protein
MRLRPGELKPAISVRSQRGGTMAWDFETDPEYQAQLDWADEFVRDQVLRDYHASDDLWPSQHIPKRLAAARATYAEYLEHEIGDQ